MTGITTADSACDEAFADRYQSDPNDPSVAQELAVWREAWALARQPYRMYTQILTMQRREEKLAGALARCHHEASYSIGGEDALRIQLGKVRDIVNETLSSLAPYRKGGDA